MRTISMIPFKTVESIICESLQEWYTHEQLASLADVKMCMCDVFESELRCVPTTRFHELYNKAAGSIDSKINDIDALSEVVIREIVQPMYVEDATTQIGR